MCYFAPCERSPWTMGRLTSAFPLLNFNQRNVAQELILRNWSSVWCLQRSEWVVCCSSQSMSDSHGGRSNPVSESGLKNKRQPCASMSTLLQVRLVEPLMLGRHPITVSLYVYLLGWIVSVSKEQRKLNSQIRWLAVFGSVKTPQTKRSWDFMKLEENKTTLK